MVSGNRKGSAYSMLDCMSQADMLFNMRTAETSEWPKIDPIFNGVDMSFNIGTEVTSEWPKIHSIFNV